MRIFKSSVFQRWADGENVSDTALEQAIKEMNSCLIDARLGGHLYKKRVARLRGGKSGGFRTLIAFRIEDKAFFMYGFSKNKQSNISKDELKSLKLMASEMLAYSDKDLVRLIKSKNSSM